jgi:hypothetical protein
MIFLALVIMVRKEAPGADLVRGPAHPRRTAFAPVLPAADQRRRVSLHLGRPGAACGRRSLPLRPLDSALAGLRYPLLFPEDELPLMSRPGVPTIYPPIAQLWLALVAFFTPRAAGTLRLQIAAAGAVVLTTWLLARFLGNRQGGSCSTEPARRSRLGSLCSSTSDGGAKAATNAGNYTPAGTAPRSSGVGRAQQARLE